MKTLNLSEEWAQTLIEIIENDCEMSSYSDIDFKDPELMQYYTDRANILKALKE